MTIDEAAAKLHMSYGGIYNLIREGLVDARREGRRWEITPAGWEWLERRYLSPTDESSVSPPKLRFYCVPCGTYYGKPEECGICKSLPYDLDDIRALCVSCLRPERSSRQRLCLLCQGTLRPVEQWPKDVIYR